MSISTHSHLNAISFADIADLVAAAGRIISSTGRSLHPTSSLGRIFGNAEAIGRDWVDGQSQTDIHGILGVWNARRVAEAIVNTQHDAKSCSNLQHMIRNSIFLSERQISRAKDALWELELLSVLLSKRIHARLDEPDIVADFGRGSQALACKKIYSAKSFQDRVKDGVRQLERHAIPGLIAVNLDDLVPENHFFAAASTAQCSDALHAWLRSFCDQHMHRVAGYISSGRCDGVLLTVHVPADVPGERPRFRQHSQTLLYAGGYRIDQLERNKAVSAALGASPG